MAPKIPPSFSEIYMIPGAAGEGFPSMSKPCARLQSFQLSLAGFGHNPRQNQLLNPKHPRPPYRPYSRSLMQTLMVRVPSWFAFEAQAVLKEHRLQGFKEDSRHCPTLRRFLRELWSNSVVASTIG